MLNSITNAMHASALAIYTYLVFVGHRDGEAFYTAEIVWMFFLTLTAKILGVIVHLPSVDYVPRRHNFVWILISVNVVALNAATLAAVHVSPLTLWLGIAATAILSALYVRSLYINRGSFASIAIAVAGALLWCAVITTGTVRLAWLALFGANVLWIGLARVKFLADRKLHNDIYHIALIAGTFFLYKTVRSGLWVAAG